MRVPGLRELLSRPYSVRGRLVLAFSALVTCLAVFVSLYVPRQVQRQALQAAAARAAALANMAAYTVAAGLYFGDAAALDETIGGVRSDSTVKYVQILDASGRIVRVGGDAPTAAGRRASSGPDAAGMVFRTSAPVVFHSRRIGEIRLGLSLEEARRTVLASRLGTAAISLLLLVIGLVWVFVISNLVSGPISRVVTAARQVAAGDLSRRVEPGPQGEVRNLAIAFNAMVERLQAAQEGLEAANRGLEDRVRERTEALQREVEERRRAKLALHESEKRFRSVFEVSVTGIAIFDDGGRILEGNPALEAMWSSASGELVGLQLTSLFGGEHESELSDLIDQLATGRCAQVRREVRAHTPDGALATRHLSLCAVRDGHEHFAFGFALVEDTTEQRDLERRLVQSQKMEAVGRLAGGIAHDFNNLLTVINGSASLALAEVDSDNPISGDLEEILASGERAATLTRQLLAFGRRQVLQPRVLHLNTVVAETSSMLRRLIGEDIRLTLTLRPGVPPVLADGGQISQVLINLVVNARDAMPDGGDLSIETGRTEIDATTAARLGTEQPGTHAFLRVRDSGHGMDEATQRVIFEPFFTTKRAGEGTGLGLATVYGIVRQSGGAINVESAPGEGASFTVLLPATEACEQHAPESGAHPALESSQATETVLLVEDERPVRQLLSRILHRAGYTVLEACNGVDGLRVAAEHQGAIDIVLSDVIMPEMGGPAMVERLIAAQPELPVIYISGYTASEVLPSVGSNARMRFLPKPSSPREVTEAVRALLDSSARV